MQKTLGGYLGHLKAFFGATKSIEGCPLMVLSRFWGQNQNLRTTVYGYQIPTLWVICAALHMHIGSARLCILSWKNYVTAKIVHVAANISHVVANILRVTADKAFEEAKCYLPRIFFHFFGIYNGENTLLSKIAKKIT